MAVNGAGPKGRPITGNLLEFRKDPLAFLQKAYKEYGDFVPIRFGPTRHVYLISDPDSIKEVLLTKQASFRKAKGLQTAKAVIGEGVLTSEGEQHMRQRRMLQPAFKKTTISRYGDTMVRYSEELISEWRSGEERVITNDMMRLTLNIITQTMFGMNLSEGYGDVSHALEVGMKYVSRRASSFIDLPFELPTKNNKEFKESAEMLDKIIYGIIQERRAKGEEDREDLLAMLLAARDDEDGTGMTDKQVRDEVMTIFLAGHETTANTLAWTFYLLSQNPDARAKLEEELDRVLTDRLPTVADLEKLPYTGNVIWEALRIYPPVWAVNREVSEEVEIGGHLLKPGDTVMMSQYVIHRSDRYFEDPEVFRPERFEGDLLKRIPGFAYFPFGGGPRICIGNHFAFMEASLVLATIARRFRLDLAEDHHKVEGEPLVTLRPKHGLRMVAEKRR
ncbi:cytochrome P450 [Paenibacillus aurantius]|uniref:Cytochrome P450 n=1 Tax=Paenibacillus aurantius TaxID=2918900 RepID=A0AA96LAY3_9BACL|nr:cytochrome P450 [Paenibacillus aurantius]WNQ10449.1 cytochrome P450 [Paenibacillus aurantius]